VVVNVTAAAISQFDVVHASGKHAIKPPTLPAVVGNEGVGRLEDGRRVYFAGPLAPHGSMAEQTLVNSSNLIDVPTGVDDATAAALGNSGLAAWLPLSSRAQLVPDEVVLIIGATGIVGRLAVQAARLRKANWPSIWSVCRSARWNRRGRASRLACDADWCSCPDNSALSDRIES
jgi:NADPH2:quinone reductase